MTLSPRGMRVKGRGWDLNDTKNTFIVETREALHKK
jgi:hypothetical protein